MTRKMFWMLVLAALILGVAIGLMAPVSHNATARAAANVPPATDAWRASLPLDPALATQAYMARLSPAAVERANAYFEGGYWLKLASLALGLAVSWALLASGVLVSVRNAVERRSRSQWLSAVAVGAALLLLSALLTWPLDVYQDFFREHAFGLANQSFGPWLSEHLVQLAISTVVGALFLSLIVLVLRRAERSWWLWATGVGLVFMVVMLLLGPVYIDPLFNHYKPLPDGAVKTPILAMARENGVPVTNVYEVDASKQSDRISANVSGIFGTAAVRLNDNLLKRTSLPEIKAVMGHELGHYVMNHIYKHLIVFGLILAIGFAFLKWSYGAAVARWGARFGLRGQSDPAALPLFIALFSVYMFVMTPLVNTQIRVCEEEADMFGLNTAREPDGFAEVSLKLTEYRKPDPGPIEEFMFFDHPSTRHRVFAAMRWKAENGKK